MKKSVITISIYLTVFCWLVCTPSCKHEPILSDPPKDSIIDSSNVTNCDNDTIYFTNTILPLLNSNCSSAGCHDNTTQADGINLTSYTEIINSNIINTNNPTNSEIYQVITETDPDKRMPPSNPLSSDQISWILTWIQQGALNNTCSDACDTSNISFSQDIFPIIQNNCQSCHSGSSPSGGISLTNYTQIKAKADDGSLVGTIDHQPLFPVMPPSGSKIDSCSITLIEKWISVGTPNN